MSDNKSLEDTRHLYELALNAVINWQFQSRVDLTDNQRLWLASTMVSMAIEAMKHMLKDYEEKRK